MIKIAIILKKLYENYSLTILDIKYNLCYIIG